MRAAEAPRRGGANSYLSEFARPSASNRVGACHAPDLPFVSATTTHPASQALLGTHPPRTLARRMHTTWIHFARHGHPHWPHYDATTRPVTSFNHPTCKL